MSFQLKQYQQDCLRALSQYLRRAAEVGAKAAFNELDHIRVKYREVPQLPELPYVCLRVPTGGGKTVLAANAVGVATREFLQADRCVALWLAPTNAIVNQTRRVLQDRMHPCRRALDTAFGGQVEIFSLRDALSITYGTLTGATPVIVSTLAALRVEDTDGRKVYEQNGQLKHIIDLAPPEARSRLECYSNGEPIPSLANVLRLARPVVIMDEAHNARTKLSFDTLGRLAPCCIIEFTATPAQEENPSNVLYSVSAAELKAEQMVKLPIRLVSRAQWREAVAAAVTKQRQLETLAGQEEQRTGEYIRPIVLFQAQSKSKEQETITVEVLRKCLGEDFSIKEEEIAEGTGQKWELPENLLDRDCPIRFVLTVAALREGWDCPFAYVLCSVSNLSSRGAVEQILGRILRLPHATAKQHPDLNLAYAYATSERFREAAESLTDALVDSGFEKFEARRFIEPDPTLPFPDDPGGLFTPVVTVTETVTAPLAVEALPDELRTRIRIERPALGQTGAQVVYTGPPISVEAATALRTACPAPEDQTAMERLVRRSRGLPVYPAALGQSFAVPRLAVRVDERLEIFEDQFRDALWSLAECDARLGENEFRAGSGVVHTAQVDVDQAGQIRMQFISDLREQLTFHDLRGPKTIPELVVWLDRSIEHIDIAQVDTSLFLRRMVEALVNERGIPLTDLVAARFRLRDTVGMKIDEFRRRAFAQSYQRMLFTGAAVPLEVGPEKAFQFPLNQYPANRLYRGRIDFKKHYYEHPADMNDEEAECAAVLDGMDEVRFWVRNLERDEFAFWLPTITGKFYPDFVAELRDGRHFVVEYKGEHLYGAPDAEQKRKIGELWAARSAGRCVFVMPKGRDWKAIVAAVAVAQS
jgi:type III restriction enzyme